MAKKLGERLVEAGLVTKEAIEQALSHQKLTGYRLGDCLAELGLIAEASLLRFLAAELNTRFVTTEKLAKAKVDQEVLDRIPVRMAEGQMFIPISIDAERKVISIVANEPQNMAMIDEIAMVTGMEEVYPFVGLRSAITAAIKKHYYGDVTAFSSMRVSTLPGIRPEAFGGDISGTRSGVLRMQSSPGVQHGDTDPRLRGLIAGGGTGKTSQLLLADRSAVSDTDYAETLNILVKHVIESHRMHLNQHSAQLARQAALVARKMGYSPREVANLVIAAHLHDLGKPHNRHFTLASSAVNPEWKKEAGRYAKAPNKLFESVHLPPVVTTILSQLYEAYDGSGVPSGLKGEEIHFGARILSALDASIDLLKNPASALGAVLPRDDVLRHLGDCSGVLYDPMVVDVVRQIHSGDLLLQRLQVDGRQLMVADPDEAVRTDLLDSLAKLGLVAQEVNSIDGAIDALLAGEVDLLVLGLRFGLGDVCGIIELSRRQPANAAMPVIVLGEPPDAAAKEQLLQASPAAVIPMPFEPDQAAVSIQGIYRDRIIHGGAGRVVRGSFDEIGPIALLEIFGQQRKSGRLSFRVDASEGYVHFERGKVVFASYNGQVGEHAVRTLAHTKSADFIYDPEALLLEMPQLDAEAEAIVTELKRAG